ncbi:hypothetical protein SYNPS1DRAFT_31676 [Syncephalis pseudoplumigaleata]|uniref:Uncharacterized protein n=1 Tax=Syncephalis pseudoplumigaleata TaxID=1712513 RepID=A0A4P9YS58_9FUNG|nr:hypothetical protein SYNPS1DRAFT_31676 [Syncephalis pseudoplumigaleata]|eukprot:RKP22697.1 hypothetical protein SYNPS1DRAFT_31676 [Syncephalis pseudoplumigaleata]
MMAAWIARGAILVVAAVATGLIIKEVQKETEVQPERPSSVIYEREEESEDEDNNNDDDDDAEPSHPPVRSITPPPRSSSILRSEAELQEEMSFLIAVEQASPMDLN